MVLITKMFCYRTRCFLQSDIWQQQDSAPAHRARGTVEYLRQATPEFISPDLWPPNSPDLNPVDYKILGRVQERESQKLIRDVHQLKQLLVEV